MYEDVAVGKGGSWIDENCADDRLGRQSTMTHPSRFLGDVLLMGFPVSNFEEGELNVEEFGFGLSNIYNTLE